MQVKKDRSKEAIAQAHRDAFAALTFEQLIDRLANRHADSIANGANPTTVMTMIAHTLLDWQSLQTDTQLKQLAARVQVSRSTAE